MKRSSQFRSALFTTRRQFLGTCSVLAGGLAACSGFLPQARVGEIFVNDPGLSVYRAILDGLVRVILPFGHSRFPAIDSESILRRLLEMFPLENERRFLGLQKTLMLFEQIELFPVRSEPLIEEERKALDVPHRMPLGQFRSIVGQRLAHDETAFKEFRRSAGSRLARFTSLALEQKRGYFDLWGNSAFLVKREFHQGLKTLVMMTAYSMEELWDAIGYGGPLINEKVIGNPS